MRALIVIQIALVSIMLVAGFCWRDSVREREREEAEAAAEAHYRGAGHQRLQLEIWQQAMRQAEYRDILTRCRGAGTSTIVYGESKAEP